MLVNISLLNKIHQNFVFIFFWFNKFFDIHFLQLKKEIFSKLNPSPSPGAGPEIILWKLFKNFYNTLHVLKNTLKIVKKQLKTKNLTYQCLNKQFHKFYLQFSCYYLSYNNKKLLQLTILLLLTLQQTKTSKYYYYYSLYSSINQYHYQFKYQQQLSTAQLNHQLTFFYTHNFYNLNIVLLHNTYHIHTHKYSDFTYILYHILIYLLNLLYTRIRIC